MNKRTGIILIFVGAIMLIWSGVTYTKKKKIIDAGPIQVSFDQKQTIGWPPYLGTLLLVGGIIIVVTARKS